MTGTATGPAPDFPITGLTAIGSERELVEFLRARRDGEPPLRLCGGGTRLTTTTAPDRPVQLVSLAAMNRILRLEPDDLTCSVEPGVTRTELDAALHARGLWLPSEADAGSLGAHFALGRASPEAPGPLASIGARALLLGTRGVLAEGKPFASGARVVKSVAGFDLHKLFVGSRGRLFAATELHLKLRTRPRAALCFAQDGLERDEAIRRLEDLRHEPLPPARLWLERRASGGAFSLHGRWDGAARVVAAALRRHGLREAEARLPTPPAVGLERVGGFVLHSRIASLDTAARAAVALRVSGGGRFEIDGDAATSEALLAALPALDAHGELESGDPARRGRGTPPDPGAAAIAARLRAALDPGQVLR
jgi:FAD/FMN-containing dehydrogenase